MLDSTTSIPYVIHNRKRKILLQKEKKTLTRRCWVKNVYSSEPGAKRSIEGASGAAFHASAKGDRTGLYMVFLSPA
jgi:hypothetical protein